MKKNNTIKGVLLMGTFVATLLLIASCTTNASEDTKEIAEDANDAKFEDNEKEEDAQFLVNAAEINLEGIRLGQLAQQKGKTAHIKALGKMMEDAHTKSQKDLVALAKRKMITIPTSETNDAKDAYTKLNGKSGNDFDKAYSDMMVNRHQNAIETYEEAYTESKDPEIINWAGTTLPELRKHLDHSIESQKKCDKM